ncbi:MAG: acyl-CoA dehydrogenase family protein [Myxococcales bacterium]|nr:acyl-CoA dehydrogenase family protein [Myxococcales bacterium]
MVDFRLSPEQEQLRNLARDFTAKYIAPKAKHHDETGEFPAEICKKAWELGLMNTHIPEAHGGFGLGMFEGALISEEFGFGCTGIGTVMDCNNLASAPVIVAGNSNQKERFLRPLTEECLFVSYCVTEPQAGSDVQAIRTTAIRKGDKYIINGQKMWITNAGKASWFFVLANTDKTGSHRGMSGFIVPANTPGITIGKKEWNMGQHASDTRAVSFDDVEIPVENRLGDEGDGFKIAMAAFDHTRPLIAAMAVGLSRAAMTFATQYAKDRKTFGKTLAEHQGIQFMIAEMSRDIEAARLLTWQAAWAIDHGLKNTRMAATAKLFAADAAMRIATDAVQIFGGYGYNSEYPVEKLMRDAKIFQIYEGTSQIQRMIIAREVLKG